MKVFCYSFTLNLYWNSYIDNLFLHFWHFYFNNLHAKYIIIIKLIPKCNTYLNVVFYDIVSNQKRKKYKYLWDYTPCYDSINIYICLSWFIIMDQ